MHQQNMIKRCHKQREHFLKMSAYWRHLVDFWVPFWRPLDYEGPIRLVFLDVVRTNVKTRYIIYCVTIVPLKLENTIQRRT